MINPLSLASDLESGLTVHVAIGIPIGDYDGPRNMDMAPNGEPYVVVTSDGVLGDGDPVPTWFVDQDMAASAWLATARRYATGCGKNLYWREKPRWVSAEFIPMDQAAALNDPALSTSLRIEVGYVWARLLCSPHGPNGDESHE